MYTCMYGANKTDLGDDTVANSSLCWARSTDETKLDKQDLMCNAVVMEFWQFFGSQMEGLGATLAPS